ncbi:gamma-glutamyltransferase family protein [Paraburkholderia sp. EG285A]|uniref:gamma-glutamyltransferase family protein n=1 Tax=Paraburkholderia sp. EG285A TaxID=3237009 RepID=UPI0034D21360
MSSIWNPEYSQKRPNVRGRKHGIATGHYLATQAGYSILEAGGNAVDAGVCAGITINVLESQQCSFSGVAPMIVYMRELGQAVSIDGLGTWPAAITPDYFAKRGHKFVPDGILLSVVSAAPAAWLEALKRYGTMSFEDVATKAIDYARDGFPIHAEMAHTLVQRAKEFPAGGEAHNIFFPEGRILKAGDIFYQKDLAKSLQYMVDEERAATSKGRVAGLNAARAAFYEGDIAHAFVQYQAENGGLLTADDFRNYQVTVESPLAYDFHGTEVLACGPWCQGPMLLQELSILKGFDLRARGHNSAEYLHLILEAIKLAASDRENYYGDPKFVDVPIQHLLSDEHAAELRAQIRETVRPYSDRYNSPSVAPETAVETCRDTTYVSVVDKWGNAFSATPSDGVMRSVPVVPGLGMASSPRGIQSRTDPNHPASIAPGKRPRLTPNPAMAIRGEDFVMPFGTPGGDLQTQAMLQVLLNMTIFGMNPQAAIEAPRVYSYSFPDSFSPHTSFPERVRTESDLPCEAELAGKGHKLERWPKAEWVLTSVCAVAADIREGTVEAAADFRRTAYGLAG